MKTEEKGYLQSHEIKILTTLIYNRHRAMIFIHLFIHAEHLYSNSSIKLLRGAPSSSMAKMSSLKVRKGSSKKVKSEAIVPGPGCTVLSRANRIRRTYCKEKNVS